MGNKKKKIEKRKRKCKMFTSSVTTKPKLEFLNNLWGLGTEWEQGYRTGTPGYIGWQNSFLILGINSWAPYTFTLWIQNESGIGSGLHQDCQKGWTRFRFHIEATGTILMQKTVLCMMTETQKNTGKNKVYFSTPVGKIV